MRFFGLVFFHESTPNRSLINVKKLFIIFSRIRGDIRAQSLTFRGLSTESQNFPRIILRKGMPFRGIILGKSKLSADYTAERHAFPRYNPRKGK